MSLRYIYVYMYLLHVRWNPQIKITGDIHGGKNISPPAHYGIMLM